MLDRTPFLSRPRRRFLPGIALAALLVALCTDQRALAWDLELIDTLSSPGVDGMSSVIAGGDGIYLAGFTTTALPGQVHAGSYDAYLRRYAPDGSEMWTRQFGTPGVDFDEGITADDTGAYVLLRSTGSLEGIANLGSYDCYVRKYDPDGDLLWTRQLGTSGYDAGYGLVSHGGALYVALTSSGTFPGQAPGVGFDFVLARLDAASGDVTWLSQLGDRQPVAAIWGGIDVDDSGVYFTGNRLDWVNETFDALVRRYTLSGALVWARSEPGPSNCGALNWDVAVHDGDAYVIAQGSEAVARGTACKQYDATVGILTKWDSSGDRVWRRMIKGGAKSGGGSFTGAKRVDATESGVYVGANTTAPFPGAIETDPDTDHRECVGLEVGNSWADKLDAYVRRYDHDGRVVWTHQFGSDVFDLVYDVSAFGAGVYASGDGSCSINGEVEFAGGRRDAFLVRFDVEPTSSEGRLQIVIGMLETLWDGGDLDDGDFTSLAGSIEKSMRALGRGQVRVAHSAIDDFVTKVDELESDGVLSPATATALVDAVVGLSLD